MDLCLKVLKESNKTKFGSYSVRNSLFNHIPYYLSGLSRAHFSPTTFLEIAVYVTLVAGVKTGRRRGNSGARESEENFPFPFLLTHATLAKAVT